MITTTFGYLGVDWTCRTTSDGRRAVWWADRDRARTWYDGEVWRLAIEDKLDERRFATSREAMAAAAEVLMREVV